jgi:hypothetical protein
MNQPRSGAAATVATVRKQGRRTSREHGTLQRSLLGFLGFKHGAALVLAALGAGVMGQLLLVAIGALRDAGGGQEVVGAAVGGAARGVAPFRIRHGAIPFGVIRIEAILSLHCLSARPGHPQIRQGSDFFGLYPATKA